MLCNQVWRRWQGFKLAQIPPTEKGSKKSDKTVRSRQVFRSQNREEMTSNMFHLFSFSFLAQVRNQRSFAQMQKPNKEKGLFKYLSLGLCSSKTSFVYQKWMSEERMNDAFFVNCTLWIHKLNWGMGFYISCPSQNFTIKTPSSIFCRSSIKTVVVAKAIKLKHMSKYNFYWTTGWKWKHRGCFVKSIHYRIYVKK